MSWDVGKGDDARFAMAVDKKELERIERLVLVYKSEELRLCCRAKLRPKHRNAKSTRHTLLLLI